ncbi:MAG: xanthine dehydrogenase family protein molybdopterin-binding subunit [Rhodospirillales bacterium]|nr:xanthine dehydrogenase family protein molybdopterin-binding subunit [Rhodospirillales bacterium]
MIAFASTESTDPRPSRRQFLLASAAAGAGLTLGFVFPGARASAADATTPSPFAAYLRIAPDNSITVLAAHMDMGQGCYNGIATLVAEELGADWQQIRVEGASGNPALYGNLAWGGKVQGTGGSSAMRSSFERYRLAGAAARTMLTAAAAETWSVPAHEIRIEKGVLAHASGRSARLGDLAAAAALQPVPADLRLKPASDWTLIGSESLRRFDSADKAGGHEVYTIDIRLPGMLTATITHPPLFGARLKSFDPAAAKAVAGVVDVVTTSRGVVVLAEDTWAALRGRDALLIDWDESTAEQRGSADLLAAYHEIAERPGDHLAAERGDAQRALAGAARIIEATYDFPYLAHAALEPLAAVVARSGDMLDVWGGHQMPDLYQAVAARIAGVPVDHVRLRVMKTGGGFGRRAVPDADVIVEAVETAKAIGFRAPVKLVWTRENDMRAGRYRPMMVHKVRVGLTAGGEIAGWHHRIVGQSILAGTPFEKVMIKDGVDLTSVEGASNLPYAIPDLRVEVTNTKVGVPVLWWRSVGHTHTAYVVETMIDEVASASGRDPLALRRALLKDNPRHRAVLDLAAAKAGWGVPSATPAAAGHGRGIALHRSFDTTVAEIADVSVDGKGHVKVERVVCAVDCGIAINPDQVRAQMEGGIGFGLGAILREQIDLAAGRVEQGNFDAYLPLRIEDMPAVEVHIVASSESPTGAGEPGVPPIGPAVANAVAAATGQRVRSLPFAQNIQA